MSEDKLEIVRRFFEAIDTTGQGTSSSSIDDAMRETADEDVIYVEDPQWPGSATYRGREAVAEC